MVDDSTGDWRLEVGGERVIILVLVLRIYGKERDK
jgi:hypothetical protein